MAKSYLPALPTTDDPVEMPEHVRDLTDKQRLFVEAMIETGGFHPKQCAAAAGYSDGPSATGLAVAAYNLMRNPKIIVALRHETDAKLRFHIMAGASALVEIAQDKMHKDRFKAADALLTRGGLVVEHKQEIVVRKESTMNERIANIRLMAEKLGLDPAALLGQAGVIVDAEFTEVTDVVSSSEDLWTIDPEEDE